MVCLILTLSIIYFIPEKRKEIKSQHFTFLFSNSIDSVKVETLAEALESNYSRIGNDLKTSPSNIIETNIYSKRWRYIKATGNWGASGSIEGISKLHFIEQAWGEKDAQKVAIHEFSHTITLKLLLDQEIPPIDSQAFDQKFANFPVWLWESISVYEANQFIDPKTLPFLSNGQYPTIPELNNRLKGGKIYECGYTIIEYILDKYGQDKLIELIKSYGDLEHVFSISYEQFSKEWYGFIKEKYINLSRP